MPPVLYRTHFLQKGFVHRDIAARNVLLDSKNRIKIADFGLTRKIPEGQDFWKLDKAGRLPVKYMSIESLTLKRFSAASDVWAFGVYLWELLRYALVTVLLFIHVSLTPRLTSQLLGNPVGVGECGQYRSAPDPVGRQATFFSRCMKASFIRLNVTFKVIHSCSVADDPDSFMHEGMK
jgi:serine/threonine protein kinase